MYPVEELNISYEDEDNGTMPRNLEELTKAVVGHRIVSAGYETVPSYYYSSDGQGLVITLDNGRRVIMQDTSDCCAYTALQSFFLDPTSVDHMILGVGTTGGYTTWHIYADFGDIMRLQVGWSAGNPFYYGYGFDITVQDLDDAPVPGNVVKVP